MCCRIHESKEYDEFKDENVSDGKLQGVVCNDLQLAPLLEETKQMKVGKTGYAFIAAKNIAGLIGQIQVDTNYAVDAMQKGTHEVKLGTQIVNETGIVFKEIVERINKVNAQLIAEQESVKQISSGSEQINQSTQNIQVLSRTASDEAQNVSAATEEQSASMNEISTASRSLSTLAQDLQNEISKFKM